MCGITGVLNLTNEKPINRRSLSAASQTIFHRGPDDEGTHIERDFGMAVRRLSIIDLACGHQPISDESGKVHIGYNGEIYNYRALRRELENRGCRFRTNCDTEVVLHAYLEWGPVDSLKRLRGMFAFAIWDGDGRSLLVARDRMGIKPLYFAEHEGRLYFASEIRGLLLHSGMPRQVDLEALDALMTVGFVTAPYTLFKGIRKLPPAHYMLVKNGRISTHRYWELRYEVTTSYSESDAVDRFRELLAESVELHMMSDVPIGALLSGGIDSVTNAALMQKVYPRPVKTVCIGFEASAFDETQQAAAAAKALGTDHSNITFTGNTLDEYPRTLYYREEPTADATFSALYFLFKACRQENLKVVLSGEGADELLGGYSWHRWEHWANPFLGLPHFLRDMLARALSYRTRGEGGKRLAQALRAGSSSIHRRYRDYLRIGDPATTNEVISPEVKLTSGNDAACAIWESWKDHLRPVAEQPECVQMLWLQSRTRMVDWVNHSVDRMSMAHSVEARPPFLDHRLWEFCATVPHRFKLGGSYAKPIEKHLLRQAGRNIVPDNTRHRKKKGLEVPHASWLAQSRLPEWAEAALSESQLRKTGLFNPSAVLTMCREHRAGAPGRATLLMGVLAVQTWAHLFIESPPESGPP